LINGYGKYTWTNGKIYEGEWLENKMSGEGKMSWPDGKMYEGGFLLDKKHGKGKLTFPGGKTTEGTWSDGKLSRDPDSKRTTKQKPSD
jgi:hypothetical protein